MSEFHKDDGCILVTGGAGYVGTHVLNELIQAGYNPVALDSRNDSLDVATQTLYEVTGTRIKTACVNLLDKETLKTVFKNYKISHVFHLAGLKAVRQSHGSPLAFYNVNVMGTINLLEVMEEYGVYSILFSSSSKVYGIPQYLPLDENHPTGQCTNPYGRTKFMVEQILQDLAKANQKWKVTILRYFNPCGAHSSGKLGEDRDQTPVNLMPIICHVAQGKVDKLTIFGKDYDTSDGTALKAYTHIVDLAQGHIAALRCRHQHDNYRVYNLGAQETCTILGMVKMFEQVSGKKVAIEFCDRKSGEIESCSADSSKAHRELGWKPDRNLQHMCEDMWKWMTHKTDHPTDKG